MMEKSPASMISQIRKNLSLSTRGSFRGFPQRVLPMVSDLKLALEIFQNRKTEKNYLWGYFHGEKEHFSSHIHRSGLWKIFQEKGVELSGVLLDCRGRKKQESSGESPQVIFGDLPEFIEVQESNGGIYQIRFHRTRHSGLFLDQEPLRKWLSSHSEKLNVLNLFCYTGSLSIAAALGKASHVDSVDLSKPTLQWAKVNETLNQPKITGTEFYWIAADAREFLKKAVRQKRQWDLVISDPPTFSRSKAGVFSTEKHLLAYHEELLSVLKPGGFLVTSINSDSISKEEMLERVAEAARNKKRKVRLLSAIQAEAKSFGPLHPLKGGIFQVQ